MAPAVARRMATRTPLKQMGSTLPEAVETQRLNSFLASYHKVRRIVFLLPECLLSTRQPPPPRPLYKPLCPLGPPAPLVAIPLEVVQGQTQLVVADPDLAKEILKV